MKLKTNKLLTLTLASSLVAITAGCGGGTKAAAPKVAPETPDTTAPDVAYSAWSGSDDVTIVAVDTDNAFLAGVAATTGASATPVTLTGVTTGATVETLNLNSIVTAATTTSGTAPNIVKGVNAVRLGGDATDGVAFATNGDTTPADLRYFAGVIAGADLGQPVATTGTATWNNGLFQTVGANPVASKTFALTVNFADSEISGIVPVGADTFATDATSYYISGSYDAAGVITGSVLYRGFATTTANTAPLVLAAAGTALTDATADDAEDSDTVGLATLSGLIGADGVLGAFYSSGSDGDGATGFAGGFVVSSADNAGGDDPDVVYADWAAGATQVAAITDNAFLAGGATDLTGSPTGATVVAINLNTVITAAVNGEDGTDGTSSTAATDGTDGVDGSQLGGDATNGVAFGSNGATTAARFFAGLHNTTDLGEPIAAAGDITGTWNGLFQAVGADVVRKAFVLTVTFGTTDGNTIAGLVPVDADSFTADAMSYYISGTYNADGLITGNILYGDFSATATTDVLARGVAVTALTAANADGATSPATDGLGVLSGLIGQDGAVGAFYSNANGATAGYAGGFVASTDTVTELTATDGDDGAAYVDPATVVNLADWTLTAATGLTANGFVVGTATGGTGQTTGAVTIDRAASAAGGVTFFRSGTAAAEFYHAAIHSDTSLGAPVSTTTGSATWEGNFGAVGETGYTTASRTAMFAVTFGSTGGTIQSTVAAGTAAFAVGSPAYHINATYTSAGLISGNILHQAASVAADAGVTAAATGTATAATEGFGTVTGLIGADGLVGVFHSSSTHSTGSTGATGFSGGFVAVPPASP